MDRKWARCVAKDLITTANSLINDLAKSGIELSRKTVVKALHCQNGLRGCWIQKTSLINYWRKSISKSDYCSDNFEIKPIDN